MNIFTSWKVSSCGSEEGHMGHKLTESELLNIVQLQNQHIEALEASLGHAGNTVALLSRECLATETRLKQLISEYLRVLRAQQERILALEDEISKYRRRR